MLTMLLVILYLLLLGFALSLLSCVVVCCWFIRHINTRLFFRLPQGILVFSYFLLCGYSLVFVFCIFLAAIILRGNLFLNPRTTLNWLLCNYVHCQRNSTTRTLWLLCPLQIGTVCWGWPTTLLWTSFRKSQWFVLWSRASHILKGLSAIRNAP
jgi:hypothetical protein